MASETGDDAVSGPGTVVETGGGDQTASDSTEPGQSAPGGDIARSSGPSNGEAHEPWLVTRPVAAEAPASTLPTADDTDSASAASAAGTLPLTGAGLVLLAIGLAFLASGLALRLGVALGSRRVRPD